MGKIRRKEDAVARKRDFVLARSLLILAAATAAVVDAPADARIVVGIVAVMGILSVLYARTVDPFAFYDRMTQSVFVVVDSGIVFGLLLSAGIGPAATIPFFLTVIAAALLENGFVLVTTVSVLAIATGFVSVGDIFDPASVLARQILIMSTAVFFWFVVSVERHDSESDGPGKPGPS